ncbi:MAG TPA: PAS domain S-box protein [Spirochaetota bacterium]|nr:PAS domain S-box protein [Spirochaetota bacterium]HPV40417.1 PAS domain S-box protein [Spirochaetota bacterium]
MENNDNTTPRIDLESWDALRESEERFRNLAESTPMAILIYQENKWIYANPAAERITGYSRQELTSMNFWEVVHPDFKKLVEERGKKRQAGENVISSYEFKIITKSGDEKWVLLNGATSHLGGKPAGLINVIDITEIKNIQEELDRRNVQLNQKNAEIQSIMLELEATNKELVAANEELMATNEEFESTNEELIRSQKELEESERRYREIFDNFPVGIFQTTFDGNFITINKEFARIIGYASVKDVTASEVNSRQLYLDPEARAILLEEVRARGYVEGYKTKFRKKNGEQIWVSINTHLRTRADGSGEYLEGFIQDITAQMQTEEDMKNLEKQLIQAQKMEAIGRLAGGIAHDFNNLLTAIMGNAEISLKELGRGSDIRENINDILVTSRRAADLTKQLLAFSRRQISKPVVVDINEFLEKVERMLRRIIGENISLVIERKTDRALIKADPSLIEQVIVNLVVNARDAMPQGGTVTIVTSQEDVDASRTGIGLTVPHGSYVRIDVVDTGVGIDRDILEKIFEPFYSTKGELGTGLGLSTVYGIVRQNDGYVTVTSEKGKGSVFSVYLPLNDAGSVEEAWEPAETAALDQTAGTETILIVEDEDHVRRLLVRALAAQGYSVLEASSSGEALRICEDRGRQIDLVLSDIVLPDIPGPQLIEKVQRIRPGIRVLYMSGYAEHKISKTEMLKEGVFFIPKPFLPSELQKKIREVLTG